MLSLLTISIIFSKNNCYRFFLPIETSFSILTIELIDGRMKIVSEGRLFRLVSLNTAVPYYNADGYNGHTASVRNQFVSAV